MTRWSVLDVVPAIGVRAAVPAIIEISDRVYYVAEKPQVPGPERAY